MVDENDRAARTLRAVEKAGFKYAKTFVSGSTLIVQTRRAAQMILLQLLYHHSISRVVRQLASRLGRQGQLSRDEEQVCTQSRLFDREWYLQRNPDVAVSGVDPLTHYIRKGAAEGRDPHPLFDSDWYLQRNPDVAASGVNPLTHYIKKGAAEGRDPHPLFDSDWYLRRNPDVAAAGMNPLRHYIGWGAAEGRDPNPHFDSDWYLERNPEVAVAGTNPLSHYIHCGSAEGRNPNPLFDTEWYLQRNPDIASSGMNPLTHYIHFGAAEAQCYYPRASWPRGSPTVSAIVPCYNGARWLAEALESIKAQSLPVQEIIVVDDASTDNSAEIAQKHGALVIGNPTNRGEGYSRNVGLRHASGDLIAWLDADDVWLPQHVSTLSALLQKYPQATAAFGAVQRFGQRNELIRGYVPPGEPSNVFWAAFSDWVHTTIGSMTYKGALLDIGGFNEHERYSVDFDLWLRLARHHLFTCTHEVTSRWRWHDAQQSKQLENQLAAVYRFRRNYWEQERAAGRPKIAAEMERRMADIWKEDMNSAWEKRDMPHLRFLWELAELVPEIPADCQPAFARRVQEPRALEHC
jgi:glycosyltransferase involved in cell wall biosynthesis